MWRLHVFKIKGFKFLWSRFFFLHIIIDPYRLICHPIYNCCTLWRGPWCFVHPLEGVQNTMDPSHSVQQLFCYTFVTLLFLFSKFCCHLQTLLRRNIHCLISRRTRNTSLVPAVVSYTALEIDQRWEWWRWCTMVYIMYITVHVTRPIEPCNMRICCKARAWFSTNQTSQFVQRYNNTVCLPLSLPTKNSLQYMNEWCLRIVKRKSEELIPTFCSYLIKYEAGLFASRAPRLLRRSTVSGPLLRENNEGQPGPNFIDLPKH